MSNTVSNIYRIDQMDLEDATMIYRNILEGYDGVCENGKIEVRKMLLPIAANTADLARYIVEFHGFLSKEQFRDFAEYNVEKIESISNEVKSAVGNFRY